MILADAAFLALLLLLSAPSKRMLPGGCEQEREWLVLIPCPGVRWHGMLRVDDFVVVDLADASLRWPVRAIFPPFPKKRKWQKGFPLNDATPSMTQTGEETWTSIG